MEPQPPDSKTAERRSEIGVAMTTARRLGLKRPVRTERA